MKKSILLLLTIIYANAAYSQNKIMKVYLRNGAFMEYQVQSIESITFYDIDMPDAPNTDPDASDLPPGIIVVTDDVSEVSPLFATVNATFEGVEGVIGKAYKYGMCIGKGKSPDVSDTVLYDSSVNESMRSFFFDDLEPNTLYYYRAVLYFDGKFYYGNSRYFTTPDLLSSFGYVDLGLSAKWGTCNLYADSPEQRGNYYAWGEIETKDEFKNTTYKYWDTNVYTYINIGDNISGTAYDAATMNYGTEWRTPTLEEIEELYDNCNWHQAKYKGVAGYLVSSKTNENCIFIPTVSCTNTSSSKAKYSQFWSATSSSSGMAYYLNYTHFKAENEYRAKEMNKEFGLPIRPVHK